ncbi:MAG: hypothetical protein ABSE41_12145 [Bacteroidota bacterium]|jgi:ABC-type polysaccharide/polyol phosphate export permease
MSDGDTIKSLERRLIRANLVIQAMKQRYNKDEFGKIWALADSKVVTMQPEAVQELAEIRVAH